MTHGFDVESDERDPDRPLVCAECGARRELDAAEREGWRVHSDGAGELLSFCRACHEREFGRPG